MLTVLCELGPALSTCLVPCDLASDGHFMPVFWGRTLEPRPENIYSWEHNTSKDFLYLKKRRGKKDIQSNDCVDGLPR